MTHVDAFKIILSVKLWYPRHSIDWQRAVASSILTEAPNKKPGVEIREISKNSLTYMSVCVYMLVDVWGLEENPGNRKQGGI